LKSDRELVLRNQEALSASVATSRAEIEEVEYELRNAETALMTVTSAVGSVREQLAAIASELNAAQRTSDRLLQADKEIAEFQGSIDRWIKDAEELAIASKSLFDQSASRQAFVAALREYLIALGHSAVDRHSAETVSIDDQFVPFMNGRRLRALGSASDQSRLVAAYSLALVAAAQQTGGKHPGILILDEPLQQNPDESHRDLFLTFLANQVAQRSGFQTLIFTSLSNAEISKLRKHGTKVITPPGSH